MVTKQPQAEWNSFGFPVLPALVLMLLALCATIPPPSFAATSVGGTIGVDGIWTEAESPYVVTSNATVASGVTLTIEVGTITKFSSGTSLTVSGTLRADAQGGTPTVFTSLKDDAAGGDTNGNGTAGVPPTGPGFLSFVVSTTGNLLRKAVVRYEGTSNNAPEIVLRDDVLGRHERAAR